jgi:hypothetical protein
LLVLLFLSAAASGTAQTTALYPRDHVAQFVVDNLDVTSFPSSIGPRREKGKPRSRIMDYTPSKLPRGKRYWKKKTEAGDSRFKC